MTTGEKLVRTTFNPSAGTVAGDIVADIKNKSAELINLVDEIKFKDPRLAALATTQYELAAMWAVKLATTTEEK